MNANINYDEIPDTSAVQELSLIHILGHSVQCKPRKNQLLP